MIPYGKQSITQEDIDAVVQVLQSDFLTQGPKVPAFEKALTDFTGAEHAYAVNSATSGLHIACLALGLGENDILWTSPITFVASANCGLYCGATVDFVDIDPLTYNMSPNALKQKLAQAEKQNALPKVVVVVHLSGQSCDMQEIAKLAQQYNFKIIEDASHAIGAFYRDKPVGACQYSDIAVFSFHPVKIVTTAEGGAVLTNNKSLATKIDLYRNHGITRNESMMENKPDGGWYYEQLTLGLNYRMTELQAALGLSQMQRLQDFVKSRHIIAKRYYQLLADLPIDLPHQLPCTYSSLHLFVIRLQLDKLSSSHQDIFAALRDAGIGVNLHYIPVYRHPFYQKLDQKLVGNIKGSTKGAKKGFNKADFPNAEAYYASAISIPIFHGMSESQQDTVVSVLSDALRS